MSAGEIDVSTEQSAEAPAESERPAESQIQLESPDVSDKILDVSRQAGSGAVRLGQLMLACFVAQGAWALLSTLGIVALLFGVSTALTAEISASGNDGLVDWATSLLEGGNPVPEGTFTLVIVGLLGIGMALALGVFVVPMLIRIFTRVICSATVPYAWALMSNLASVIALCALTSLLWVLPGAQPIAGLLVALGSPALCAVLLMPRVARRPMPNSQNQPTPMQE